MWYKTEKEAGEACREKEKKYECEFYALKDSEQKDCYWAQRKIQ